MALFRLRRTRNEGERERCERVRSWWNWWIGSVNCITQFSDVNLGAMMGKSTAMDWFWEKEEEGIVLEDDTLPAQSFFRYCDALLERYRHDERVWCIMGNNLMTEWPRATGAGLLLLLGARLRRLLGWAGWRRVWKQVRRGDEGLASGA